MKVKLILIICVVFALVSSCAKPPIAEMDSAKEAVFKAESDEDVVRYAASTLARARDALRRMQVEADSKRYDAAKTYAAEAISNAEKAIAEGKAGSNRVRDESASLLSGLRPAIDETARNINSARYRQLRLNYDQLNRELNNASDVTEQAEVDHAMGRYQEAMDNGRSARSIISGINEKITGVATGASAKK